jgi:heme exporter protein CcmD
MDAYIVYVWPCYFLVFISFTWHVVSVVLEKRKILHAISQMQYFPERC